MHHTKQDTAFLRASLINHSPQQLKDSPSVQTAIPVRSNFLTFRSSINFMLIFIMTFHEAVSDMDKTSETRILPI